MQSFKPTFEMPSARPSPVRRHGAGPRPERHYAVSLDRDSPSLRDVRQRERIYRRSLALADTLAVSLALLLAIDVFGGHRLRVYALLLVIPLVVVFAKVSGLYDKDELVIDHSTLNELPRLLNLAMVLALLLWLLRQYMIVGNPTTLDLLVLCVLLATCLVAARSSARAAARRRAPIERCVLVGRRAVFERLEQKVRGYPRVALVGMIETAEIAHRHARLPELAEQLQAHRIIIDTDDASSATTLDIVRVANATGLQVSLLPSMLSVVGGSVVFDDLGGLLLMGVPRFGLSRSSLTLKRIFDVLGAGLALTASAPLMAVLAADHPLAGLESVDLAQLKHVPFVLFESGRASALGNLSVFVVIVLTRIYFQAMRLRKEAA